MKKLLWCGDADVSSGFARCTHNILDNFTNWDINVLGINYRGDPHKYNYPIYPCYSGGDLFGVQRIKELISKIKPDVLIIQNDPWNIPAYIEQAGNVPVIATIAVDGLNCKGRGLNGLANAVFWTNFGQRQAERGGYTGISSVIPLGIDLDIYRVKDKSEARKLAGLPKNMKDVFIVGNVNRNQPRKRLDLTIINFATWIKEYNITDAYLYLHVAPTGDFGYDAEQLVDYYGVANRLILAEPEIGKGYKEQQMVTTYNIFDAQITTTQGEGWGLTTMEGMACGVPQIIPDWAALGEWAKDAAYLVNCNTIAVTPNNINVIGGVVDGGVMVKALNDVYEKDSLRSELICKGLDLVEKPEYNWINIAEKFQSVVEDTLSLKVSDGRF